MGKLGHLLNSGQYFAHGLSSVSIPHYLGSFGYGLLLWDWTKPMCYLNCDFSSDSGMCA